MSLQKTREFIFRKPTSKLYKSQILNADKEVIGTYERKQVGDTYHIRDLNGNPIMTIHKNVIFFKKFFLSSMRYTYDFYKGGVEDENKFLGKLRSEETVNWLYPVIKKGQAWFEDPNENKVLMLIGKSYRTFKILKDDKIVAEVNVKLFKNLPK